LAAPYQSATTRLRELPAVFTGRDLTVRFQWPAVRASNYLVLWRRAGLVRALGGHSDVFMNLVVQPVPDTEAAARRVLPEATRVGMDVLREAGWTTQVQRLPDVAVLPASPRYALTDFQLQTRPARWFERVRPGLFDPGVGLRRLGPAWALADMIDRFSDRRVRHAWLPDADDLDLDRAQADPDTAAALAAFGLPADAFSPPAYEAVLARRP
jgi:hypothetical protein